MISFFKQAFQVFTWVIVVAPWEQAIRVRLGKHVKKLEAGIYLRIPFVDRVFKQSIRRRINIINSQTLTTKDYKVITCSGSIGFSIGDLEKLYETLEAPNDTLENEVAGIIAEFVGNNNLDDIKYSSIKEYVNSQIDFSKYGLKDQEFHLVTFAMTNRTYRLVTGGLDSWAKDSQLKMEENKN